MELRLTKEQRTKNLISHFKGISGEYEMLKGVVACTNKEVDPNLSSDLAHVFDKNLIITRLHELLEHEKIVLTSSEQSKRYVVEHIPRSDANQLTPVTKISSNEKQSGVVKFFDDFKGFGFIIDDTTKRDIFVHVNDITAAPDLFEGQHVSFTLFSGKRGPQAGKVDIHCAHCSKVFVPEEVDDRPLFCSDCNQSRLAGNGNR